MYFPEIAVFITACALNSHINDTAIWQDQANEQVAVVCGIAATTIVINLFLAPSSLICGLVAFAALVSFKVLNFAYPCSRKIFRRPGMREKIDFALFSTGLFFAVLLVVKVIQSLAMPS